MFFHQIQPRDIMAPITRVVPNGQTGLTLQFPLPYLSLDFFKEIPSDTVELIKICLCDLQQFSPFSNKPLFSRICSLLKTLWEKEELLISSNFSFSNNVFFYLFGEFSALFIKIKILPANSLNLEPCKICRLAKNRV